ncbi:G-type lectin S-receptor-like serine/threonine-protein kinase RLK1 [Platanthera guangdongensis]|uniref:Receptor-like serine/threonine-protein kinase n=1 Tax=Platanthera guangdongensis TaxID=2320717 RepID=A0ABR2MTD7_9ASPA
MNSLPLVIFVFLLPSCLCTLAKAQQDGKIPKGSVITATKKGPEAAWTSRSGLFAFGFYPVETKFSIGIWLVTNITTVIWTYDRDGELFPEGTQLKLTEEGLQIPNPAGDRAVSNITTSEAKLDSAVMEDSGDFVILDVNGQIMWQTFDYPTDTLVSGQLLRSGNKLVSSVSATNHASGRFEMVMQLDGNLVMYPANTPENGANAYWSLGTNGVGYTAVIFSSRGKLLVVRDVNATHNNTLQGMQVTPSVIIGRMEPDGVFRIFQANNNSIMQIQGEFLQYQADKCSIKGTCGSNSYCHLNAATVAGNSSNLVGGEAELCLCLPGFVYKDMSKPYMGCNRNFSVGQYAASAAAATEFLFNTTYSISKLTNISWVDASYNNTGYATEKDCSDACLWDSNCYAALFSYHRCRKQRHPFLYARPSDDDDPTIAFIKVGSGEPQIPPPPPPQEIIDRVPTNKVLIQSVAVASASIFAFSAAVFFLYIIINRRSSYQKQCRNMEIGLAGGMAPRYFTYRKLVEATKNFTNPLGKGGYSTVFRGEVQLGDGKVMHIAVKRLEKLSWENERGFRTEMRAAGRAHHRNLVRLLGFCHEGGKFLLIYELMSQGSLADLIFEPKADQLDQMQKDAAKAAARPSWKKRAGMAMDVARVILYLHEGCESTIIHGDIKPDNVLVAEDGTAKVGDLGLATLLMSGQSKVYTTPKGTPWYQAPEWMNGVRELATPKVDVYSYGVLLLELITCRKYFEREAVDGHYHLSGWAKKCLMESTLERMLPENKEEEKVDEEELKKMVMVALWCVQKDPGNRKSMKEVVRMLGGKKSIPLPPDDTF